MSGQSEKRRWFQRRVSREIMIAAAAVGAIAAVMSHPAVMSLAGFDLNRQRAAAIDIDHIAVGSIPASHKVHGLAGIVKGLRLGRD